MVEVVAESPVQQTSGFVNNFFMFIANYWGLILGAIIIFILGVVIYMILKKWEEERRERDEPGFQVYNNTRRTCALRAKSKKIRKTTAWGWFFFPPLFWLAFILKKEHSNKLVNQFDEVLGYYRGECKSMDGTINYMVYKTKMLGLFENLFVIKIPIQIKIRRKRINKLTRVEEEYDDYIDLQRAVINLPNGDIKVNCIDVERLGQYYYCPVFTMADEKGLILDYRKVLEGSVADNTYQVMVQRLLNTAARQMERGILLNPNLVYNQKLPEKTKEEDRLDKMQ